MSNLATKTDPRVRIGDRVTICPRGKRGIYTADFWLNEVHQRRSLKTANFTVARQRAIKIEAELATGEYAAPPKSVTIADAVEEYMASKKGEGRKPKTLVKYRELPIAA